MCLEKPLRHFCFGHIIYRINRIGGMSAAEDAENTENAGGGIAADGLVRHSTQCDGGYARKVWWCGKEEVWRTLPPAKIRYISTGQWLNYAKHLAEW